MDSVDVSHPAGQQPVRPSHAQERLWVLDKLEHVGAAYNRAAALRLQGPLAVEALERALARLIARHAVLRARYPAADGLPVVDVPPPGPVSLPVEDLSGEATPLDAAVARASDAVAAPYDLEQGPLFRPLLYRLGDTDHLLVLAVHEMAADSQSWIQVQRELAALYGEQVAGTQAGLPPRGEDFFALAEQQRRMLEEDGELLSDGLQYWQETLSHAPPLELPTSYPRGSEQRHRGDVVTVVLEPALRRQLTSLGRELGATPFMMVLALFQLLLARYSRQQDLVVGVAEAGRSDSATEGMVGFLLNVMAMRARLDRTSTFATLVEQALSAVLESLEFAAIPFDRVVGALDIRRDSSRAPLVQAMLTYERLDAPPAFHDLVVEEVRLERRGAISDIALYAVEREDALICDFEYDIDLFHRDFVEGMAQRFERLARAVVQDPDAPVLSLPLLNEAEQQALVRERAGRVVPELATGSFLEWVREQAARRSDALAVEDEAGECWTYAQLWALAERVAAGLAGRGLGSGGLVGVNLERGAPMLAVVLGILRAGAAYVPLDPDFPPERLRYMVEDSGARLVITDDPGAAFGEAALVPPEALLEAAADAVPEHMPGADDLAYVIYTSGSTGRPKGVEIPHGALRNFLGSMRDDLGLDPEDRLLAVTTLSFDIAGLELFLPLCVGAGVLIADTDTASDGGALAELLDASGATVMQATPASWRMLLDAGWGGGLRLLLCGGEALPEGLVPGLLERGEAVWNLYGPTETTIWSTAERLASVGPVRVGRPLANTRVYVLDEAGQLVPDGVHGEIWIAGSGVARGYHGRPDLTEERFRPDPFVEGERMYGTGDLGRWTPDGRLEHLGRVDFQLKVHGYRIEAGEIEAGLEALPEIRQAVVVARGEAEDKRLVAYVVFEPGQELLAGEMRRHLMETLPHYMVPGLLVPMESMPLTPNGKVDRKALPDPLASAAGQPEYEAPESPAERVLADVWQGYLDVGRVGRHDNFFELGGHSLMAMRVLAALDKRLPGAGLQPREFYYLSVAQLAAQAEANGCRLPEGEQA
ncbi:MAG: amino acid adenylation domain-containing protein [Ectothiorhodospiraceae bacterium]|nr:amino acid adenylation domain-containing protein [Ectothiorhodospiraceae bacterium]